MRRARISFAAALLATLGGCACDTVPASAVTACEAEVRIGAARTDILFVIDDSGSMGEEQQYLKANLATFIDRLANGPLRNEFQIAVTTTSVEDFSGSTTYWTGAPVPGLPFPAGRFVAVDPRALTDDAFAGVLLYDPAANAGAGGFTGSRILASSSATLLDDFKTNVRVGTGGTGKEQHLRAARAALTTWVDGAGVVHENAGFLRSGARLAIVFLTDEDDCSETGANTVVTNVACHTAATKANVLDPIVDFVAFLDAPIAGELRDPIVGVIAGVDPNPGTNHLKPALCNVPCPGDPAQNCAEAFDTADRLTALVDLLPANRRYLDSICNLDYGPALTGIADLLVPQKVPLDNAPSDWRLLTVVVTKADGTAVPCRVAAAATPDAALADVIFTPPQPGEQATLEFRGGGSCQLHQSDKVQVRLVCAG